jgi:hypothetical protein
MKQKTARLRFLLWLFVCLLMLVAVIIDWQWTKYRGWPGCLLSLWGTYYFDRRIVAAKAYILSMDVDSTTPRDERLATDVAGWIALIGGLLIAFDVYGLCRV